MHVNEVLLLKCDIICARYYLKVVLVWYELECSLKKNNLQMAYLVGYSIITCKPQDRYYEKGGHLAWPAFTIT